MKRHIVTRKIFDDELLPAGVFDWGLLAWRGRARYFMGSGNCIAVRVSLPPPRTTGMLLLPAVETFVTRKFFLDYGILYVEDSAFRNLSRRARTWGNVYVSNRRRYLWRTGW